MVLFLIIKLLIYYITNAYFAVSFMVCSYPNICIPRNLCIRVCSVKYFRAYKNVLRMQFNEMQETDS